MKIQAGRQVLIAFVGLLPLLGASFLLAKKEAERPIRTLTSSDLRLRFEQARWTRDDMVHRSGFAMPPQMTPDFPAPGHQRLAVEFTVFNPTSASTRFDPAELVLVSAPGTQSRSQSTTGPVTLTAGQSLTAVVGFDAPEGDQALTLYWERAGVAQRILSTRAPPQTTPVSGATAWPSSVDALPEGDPREGRALYHGALACFSCHGDLSMPGSNTVGPSLEGIALEAGDRVEGVSARQYLYEALIDPDAAIAPRCANDQPCARPSAMPWYGDRISQRDAAHLLAFLMSASSSSTATRTP